MTPAHFWPDCEQPFPGLSKACCREDAKSLSPLNAPSPFLPLLISLRPRDYSLRVSPLISTTSSKGGVEMVFFQTEAQCMLCLFCRWMVSQETTGAQCSTININFGAWKKLALHLCGLVPRSYWPIAHTSPVFFCSFAVLPSVPTWMPSLEQPQYKPQLMMSRWLLLS